MKKNELITVGGVFLAFMIAVVGFFVMQSMIQIKSKNLLSESGNVKLTPYEMESIEGEDSVKRSALTEQEILEVLQSIESNEKVQPHEPMKGQISMEIAIDKAREWTDDFYTQYLTEDNSDLLEYTQISPKLCVKQNSNSASNGSEVLNSFWTVIIETDKIRVELIMNAVTAQVLQATVTSFRSSSDLSQFNVEQLLDNYIASFGLQKSVSSGIVNGYVYKEIEGKQLFAIAKMASIVVSNGGTDNTEFKFDLSMYLSTELPSE